MIDKLNDRPLQRHDLRATITTRSEVRKLEGQYNAPADTMPESVETMPLIVNDYQVVKFADQYFNLREEGLYRFFDWGEVRYQHPLGKPEIIDAGKRSSALIVYQRDILSLLGAIAVLTVHGHTHDRASHEERLARMKLGQVALTCGSIAKFMCTLLADLGWQTRIIQCCRIEGVYDTYNCGHLLFEFYWPEYRKWVLADVDTHQMFTANGEYLNLAEAKDLLDTGKSLTLEPLTIPGLGLIDTTETVTTDFTGMALFDHLLLDPERLQEWYRLMFAAVALNNDGIFYCPDAWGRKRIAMYYPDAGFAGRKEWIERYYDNPLPGPSAKRYRTHA